MSTGISRIVGVLAVSAVALLAGGEASAAPDWSKVKAKNVWVFYPAQVAWERLMSPGRHSGRSKFIAGKNCFSCHGNIDEDPLGSSLVHAEKDIEPTPIPMKPGAIKMAVKVAHDADTFYTRLDFELGEQPNAAQDKDWETKVTMMLDDGTVPEMTRAGCWAVCHDDVNSMNRGQENITKYIFASRMPGEGGTIAIKPEEELAKLRAEGNYLEYWQARINPGKRTTPVDGIILEKRTENAKPAITVSSSTVKGVTTVIMSRKMKPDGLRKAIVPGKTYSLGFAIHGGNTAHRFHYVSFERSMVLDQGEGDFVAELAPSAPAPAPKAVTPAAPKAAPAAK